jgi:hypothetical protein
VASTAAIWGVAAVGFAVHRLVSVGFAAATTLPDAADDSPVAVIVTGTVEMP